MTKYKYIAEVETRGEDWDDDYDTEFISLFNKESNCINQLKSYAIITLQFFNEDFVKFKDTVDKNNYNLYQSITIDDLLIDEKEEEAEEIEKFKTNFNKLLEMVKQEKKYREILDEVEELLHQEHYRGFRFSLIKVKVKD